jgi:DNA-binding MarR family transcriptional regulator
MTVFVTIWNVFLPVIQSSLVALHDYTGEVLGSKAGIRVLKTLVRYRGKVFTIRELAKTAGLSHPEVSLVVKDLESRGVVRLQPVGRALQVTLNDDSYILKAVVEPLITAEEKTLSALVSTVKSFFSDRRISSVAVFGSVAKGLERRHSDIDVLIISNDRELANNCAARAGAATLSRFGLGLSPLIMDETTFARRQGEDLTNSILESYIQVWGRDLREIVEKAGR